MINRNLAQGITLAVIALTFGGASLTYRTGTLSHAGPGLFPLLVSGALGVLAVISIVRSRLVAPEPIEFSFKNIGVILAGLFVFAGVTVLLNMTAAIIAMIFIVSFATTSFSISRNLKIAAGLLTIAFAFKHFLGMNLPLL